jgi:hypothetical protein
MPNGVRVGEDRPSRGMGRVARSTGASAAAVAGRNTEAPRRCRHLVGTTRMTTTRMTTTTTIPIMAPFARCRGGDGCIGMLLLPLPRRWSVRSRPAVEVAVALAVAVALGRGRTAESGEGNPNITEYPDASTNDIRGGRMCDIHRPPDRHQHRRGVLVGWGRNIVRPPIADIRQRSGSSRTSNVVHRRLDRNRAGRRNRHRPPTTTFAGGGTMTASSAGARAMAAVDRYDPRCPVVLSSTVDPFVHRRPVVSSMIDRFDLRLDPCDPRRPGVSHPPVTIMHRRRALRRARGMRRWNDGRHIAMEATASATASEMAFETESTRMTVGAYIPRHITGPIRSGPGGDRRERRGGVESAILRWSPGIRGARLGIPYDGRRTMVDGNGKGNETNGNGKRNLDDVRRRAVAESHARPPAIRRASVGA